MAANNDSACTQAYNNTGTIKNVTLSVLFDSGDGSFANAALTTKIEGFLLQLATNPGATAPDANYDITLEDADGIDVLQTVGTNRHTTNSERVDIPIGTYHHPVVSLDDTLTLKISGNATNSALTVIKLYYSAASD